MAMTTPDTETSTLCRDCRYWEHLGESLLGEMKELVDAGNCKRYPQYVNRAHNDWCGEWQSKEIGVLQRERDAALAEIERLNRELGKDFAGEVGSK